MGDTQQLHINIPSELKDAAEEAVEKGGYMDLSEFIRECIRDNVDLDGSAGNANWMMSDSEIRASELADRVEEGDVIEKGYDAQGWTQKRRITEIHDDGSVSYVSISNPDGPGASYKDTGSPGVLRRWFKNGWRIAPEEVQEEFGE